jgi:hypothetical protein
MKRYEVQIGTEIGSEVLTVDAESPQEAAQAAAEQPIWDEPGVFTVVVFDENDIKTTWKLRIPDGEAWRHNE